MLRLEALHRTLLRLAMAGAHVFAWVFVFQYFNARFDDVLAALGGAALVYALTQIAIVVLTPLAANGLRHGLKRSMLYGTLVLAAAFAALGIGLSENINALGTGIIIFCLLLGVYRALYWVSYTSMPAKGSSILAEALIALAPAAGGIALALHSQSTVILACAFLVLLSALPLLRVAEVREGFSWSFMRTFHELFSQAYARMTLRSFLDGVEGAALLLLWPLLVFILLGWSYPLLGIVVSATFLLTMVMRGLFGGLLASATRPVLLALALSAWTMRLFIVTPLSIVLVDTYHRATPKTGDMLLHEQAADSFTYVDEHTALKEMALALGRMSLCLVFASLCAFGSLFLAFAGAFAIAALAAAVALYLN